MIVRSATAADLDPIAALHVESWRSTYRGILPDEYLDGLVEENRLSHWHKLMKGVDGERIILVAEANDGLVGFAATGPCEEDDLDGYIEHIHVRPDLRGSGIGRRLLGEVAERLAGRGNASAYLLVYSDNHQAIRFYERLGGVTIADGMEEMAGIMVARSRVEWRDLASLVKACRIP